MAEIPYYSVVEMSQDGSCLINYQTERVDDSDIYDAEQVISIDQSDFEFETKPIPIEIKSKPLKIRKKKYRCRAEDLEEEIIIKNELPYETIETPADKKEEKKYKFRKQFKEFKRKQL